VRDASLRHVFEALAKSTGLNFIFDRDVRQESRTTIFVRNSSIEDVLRFVLVTNQLERKVLSDNTVLVYPNTPAKQRDYQDLVTKTFYLANADVKTVASMIKTMVKTKDMHIDEKLNLIVMRDTFEAVRMAERLVANQDLAEPEVMLEVEALESGRTCSTSSASATRTRALQPGRRRRHAGHAHAARMQNRSSELVRVSISDPALALNFRNQIDRSNLLANPASG